MARNSVPKCNPLVFKKSYFGTENSSRILVECVQQTISIPVQCVIFRLVLGTYFNIHDFSEGKNTAFNNKHLVINANLTKSNFGFFLLFWQMDETTTFCHVSNYYQF